MKMKELLSSPKKKGGNEEKKENFQKEMLINYFENNPNKILCVHIIANTKKVPLTNSYDISSYLEDLKDGGIIKMLRRESCAYKNYPHNTYKFVPKNERENGGEEMLIDEKPKEKNVFKVVTNNYDVGDEFLADDISKFWIQEHRKRVRIVLSNMARSNFLLDVVDKVGKKNKNVYKLRMGNYEDRKKTRKEDKDKDKDKKEYECSDCGETFTTKQGLSIHRTRWCDGQEEEEELEIPKEVVVEEVEPESEIDELKKEIRELKHILIEEVAVRDVLEMVLEHEREQTRMFLEAKD